MCRDFERCCEQNARDHDQKPSSKFATRLCDALTVLAGARMKTRFDLSNPRFEK